MLLWAGPVCVSEKSGLVWHARLEMDALSRMVSVGSTSLSHPCSHLVQGTKDAWIIDSLPA